MSYDPDDTIAAIATATRGGAHRGMVRLTGPQTVDCLRQRFVASDGRRLEAVRSAQAIAGHWHLEDDAAALPCDVFLWPTSRSYTRQPLAELHTIGSPPLLDLILHNVCREGARLAQPGEFTLRAFLAGRLDLTQAEGVLGVVDAADPAQRDVALSQLAGGMSRPLHALREQLLQLLAELEAGLDFVDEDIEFITSDQMRQRLGAAVEQMAALLTRLRARTVTTTAVQAVLAGPPNVGKSRLFNALVQRFATKEAAAPRALVSDTAGTTRDYLVATLDLDGVACDLVDTAGSVVAPSGEATDTAAQQMTDRQHRQAEVLIQCWDATASGSAQLTRPPAPDGHVVAITKCDASPQQARALATTLPAAIMTSSVTGEGLDKLATQLRKAASVARSGDANVVTATAARCRDSVQRAHGSLWRALELVAAGGGNELVAAELRTALDQLGLVVGAVYTDDILDRVFSSFCIGK